MTKTALKFSTKTSVIESIDKIDEQQHHVVRDVKKQLYKKYSPDDLRKCIVSWTLQKNKTNLKSHCKKWQIPRSTIQTYLKECPIFTEIRNVGGSSLEEVEAIFDEHMKVKEKKQKKHLDVIHELNTHLSECEEGCLANIAILMGHCGRGINKEELLELMNLVLIEKKDRREFIPATMKSIEGLMKRNNKLRTTVRNACSLDSCRAVQATEDIRDSFFTKLDNYVILLNEMGILREKSYCNIKSSCIYNMDECAVDTTRTKKSIISAKDDAKRLYLITPEGDGKMNLHITIGLTSHADGSF